MCLFPVALICSQFPDSPTEEAWSDWEGSAPEIKCLVCSVVYTKFSSIKQHMRSQHRIDLDNLCRDMSYYKQVGSFFMRLSHWLMMYNLCDYFCANTVINIINPASSDHNE